MTNSNWTKQGETLSHKNACKEFDLTEEQIIAAMRSGELEFKKNYAHGNLYFRLLRKQVESLAKKLHGSDNLKANKVKHELKVVTR